MPKNTIGGKGHKKSKKQLEDKKAIVFKESGTDYACVLDLLGNGRIRVKCFGDNKERLGHIRGTLYKKVWIVKDDIILVSLRDFEDLKCDILHKYTQDDIMYLIKKGEIDEILITNKNGSNEETEIIFDEQDQQEIDIDNI